MDKEEREILKNDDLLGLLSGGELHKKQEDQELFNCQFFEEHPEIRPLLDKINVLIADISSHKSRFEQKVHSKVNDANQTEEIKKTEEIEKSLKLYFSKKPILIEGASILELPIDEALLKKIHKILLQNEKTVTTFDTKGKKTSMKIIPGEYRKTFNGVLTSDGQYDVFPSPSQIHSVMEYLCGWIYRSLQQNHHASIVAILAHYNLVRIHPFDDGNGRLARLLLNIILMKKNYPTILFKQKDISFRKGYLESLEKGHSKAGNLIPFFEFMLNLQISQLTEMMTILKNL